MNILEYITNSIKLYGFNDKAYKYIGEKVDWVEAYLIHIVFGVLGMMLGALINREFIVDYFFYFFILITIILLGPFVLYGLTHLFFKMQGGKAKFTDFFKYCFSLGIVFSFIKIISFIVILIVKNLDFYLMFDSLKIINRGLIVMFVIYSLVVSIKTLSKLQNVSVSRGFMAIVIFPIITFSILFILLLILMTIGFLAKIS